MHGQGWPGEKSVNNIAFAEYFMEINVLPEERNTYRM